MNAAIYRQFKGKLRLILAGQKENVLLFLLFMPVFIFLVPYVVATISFIEQPARYRKSVYLASLVISAMYTKSYLDSIFNKEFFSFIGYLRGSRLVAYFYEVIYRLWISLPVIFIEIQAWIFIQFSNQIVSWDSWVIYLTTLIAVTLFVRKRAHFVVILIVSYCAYGAVTREFDHIDCLIVLLTICYGFNLMRSANIPLPKKLKIALVYNKLFDNNLLVNVLFASLVLLFQQTNWFLLVIFLLNNASIVQALNTYNSKKDSEGYLSSLNSLKNFNSLWISRSYCLLLLMPSLLCISAEQVSVLSLVGDGILIGSAWFILPKLLKAKKNILLVFVNLVLILVYLINSA